MAKSLTTVEETTRPIPKSPKSLRRVKAPDSRSLLYWSTCPVSSPTNRVLDVASNKRVLIQSPCVPIRLGVFVVMSSAMSFLKEVSGPTTVLPSGRTMKLFCNHDLNSCLVSWSAWTVVPDLASMIEAAEYDLILLLLGLIEEAKANKLVPGTRSYEVFDSEKKTDVFFRKENEPVEFVIKEIYKLVGLGIGSFR